MLSAEPTTLAILGIITAIGTAFCLFGYALAEELLAWLGWIVGAVGGALVWWVQSSQAMSTTIIESQVAELLVLLGVGAVAGRLLLPLFTRFTVMIAGFVSTGGSVFVYLTGGQLTRTLASNVGSQPTTIASKIAEHPELQTQQIQNYVVIALVAGLLGAILALKFYELIVTGATTAIGAGLLATVVPLWQEVLSGGLSLEEGLDKISPLWFGIALALGLGFQLYFYQDEIDIPFVDTDNEVEPLE